MDHASSRRGLGKLHVHGRRVLLRLIAERGLDGTRMHSRSVIEADWCVAEHNNLRVAMGGDDGAFGSLPPASALTFRLALTDSSRLYRTDVGGTYD